jgi:hypothetical protein
LFALWLLSLDFARPLTFVSAHIFRTMLLLDYVSDRTRREFLAGGALNRVNARAAVREDRPLAAVKINGLTLKILNYASAIDNRRVVHDEITPAAEVIMEMVDVAKYEE